MSRKLHSTNVRSVMTLIAILSVTLGVVGQSGVYAQSSSNPEGKSRLEVAKEKLQQLRRTERVEPPSPPAPPTPTATSPSTPAAAPAPAPAPTPTGTPAPAPVAAEAGAPAPSATSTPTTPSTPSTPPAPTSESSASTSSPSTPPAETVPSPSSESSASGGTGSGSTADASSGSGTGSAIAPSSGQSTTNTGGGIIVTTPQSPAPAPQQPTTPDTRLSDALGPTAPIVIQTQSSSNAIIGSSGSTGSSSGTGSTTPAPSAPKPAPEPVAQTGGSFGTSSGGTTSSPASGVTTLGVGTSSSTPSPAPSTGSPAPAPTGQGPSAPIESKPVLVAGSGYTGPTVNPPAIGVGQFADARAIARWNVIEGQPIETKTAVGVLAFHAGGINRVEFSVNGGPWASVRLPSLNAQTNTPEYWVWLDPTNMPDGPVELRAVAYPNIGLPRVLDPLNVVTNAGKTIGQQVVYLSPTGDDVLADGSRQKPFRSLLKAFAALHTNGGTCDGDTIYLTAGTYDFSAGLAPGASAVATTRRTYVTLTPAPGVTRDQVTIAAWPGAGVNTQYLRLSNLTLGPNQIRGNFKTDQRLWIDNCEFFGAGQDVGPNNPAGGFNHFFVNDSTIRDVCNGFGSRAVLLRNTIFTGIGSDSMQGVKMAINVTVKNVDRKTKTGFHPDVVQWHEKNTENRIVYGLTAVENIVAIGIGSGESCTDIAIVNTKIANKTQSGTVFSFGGPVNHLYVLNSSFVGPCLWRVDRGFVPRNVALEDSKFLSGTRVGVTPYGGPLTEAITVRSFNLGFD
jgi:hypothetical protein